MFQRDVREDFAEFKYGATMFTLDVSCVWFCP